jgi:hypothetical protein
MIEASKKIPINKGLNRIFDEMVPMMEIYLPHLKEAWND